MRLMIWQLTTKFHIRLTQLHQYSKIFFSSKPVTDYKTSKNADGKKFNKLFTNLLKNGVFIAPSQFESVFLSDAHTDEDITKTLGAYGLSLKAVKH